MEVTPLILEDVDQLTIELGNMTIHVQSAKRLTLKRKLDTVGQHRPTRHMKVRKCKKHSSPCKETLKRELDEDLDAIAKRIRKFHDNQ